jgi:hypothetical protein
VSEVTYYRWQQEYGGLKTEQVKRLKKLETENTRLRRAISELTLNKLRYRSKHDNLIGVELSRGVGTARVKTAWSQGCGSSA